MADDKKNIPDAGKVDNPPDPGKVEPAKTAPPAQDQLAPAKTEAPKDKDAPAPSKESVPRPGKDEKQTTIPGLGDSPTGKLAGFMLPGKMWRRALVFTKGAIKQKT